MFNKIKNLMKRKINKEEVREDIILDEEKTEVDEKNENAIALDETQEKQANDETELPEEILVTKEEEIAIEQENSDHHENNNTIDDLEVSTQEINEERGVEELEENKLDNDYIKEIKIIRGKSIKAIDVYTNEEVIYKTHKECSKKLKVDIEYIKENLMYGYTDYYGPAINYLNSMLSSNDEEYNYLEKSKTPSETYSELNDRIFSSRLSQVKRDEILSSDNIEPIKMHYMFECIDEEYDEYFNKYKSIIKRGGSKKIELVDKKGEAIEVFKSIDECANYINKDRKEVIERLRTGDTKVGRHEIRYSTRNI